MSNDKLGALFEKSIARRRTLLQEFEAVRLVDGVGDGFQDIFVDKFGASALIHIRGEKGSNEYTQFFLQTPLWGSCGVTEVYIRERGKDAAENAQMLPPAIKGSGTTPCWVKEHGVSYLIDPTRHINAGFFIDTRAIRHRLTAESKGKRVLNLFCYTGSLGLSAFAGGAREVTQVDISKGILSWAKENFEHNQGLNPQGAMRFIPEDSKVFLEREKRRVERGAEPYDIVLIDPPSFSRSKRGTFKVERDLASLVSLALGAVIPGGELYVTTNLTTVHPHDLMNEIRDYCGADLKTVDYEELMPPTDFPSPLGSSIAMRGVRIRPA